MISPGARGTTPAPLLTDAPAECGVPPLSSADAVDIGSTAIAALQVTGRHDEWQTLEAVTHLLSHAFAVEGRTVEAALQPIRDLEGEWARGDGRSEVEIRTEIRSRCAGQLARSAWPRLITGRTDAVIGKVVP